MEEKSFTYSEDGKFMWNGDEWIPSPPDYIHNEGDVQEKIVAVSYTHLTLPTTVIV